MNETAGNGALNDRGDARRIVIVGPCASGKSTLAEGLRRLGFEAIVSGQEHSDIPTLWRHTNPDVVVSLGLDLATLRQRRGEATWPGWLFDLQQRRLRTARDAATIRIDTTRLDPAGVLAAVTACLRPLPDDPPARRGATDRRQAAEGGAE